MKHQDLVKQLRHVSEPTPTVDLATRIDAAIPERFQRRPLARARGMAVAAGAFVLIVLVCLALAFLPGHATTALAATLAPVANATANVNAVHVALLMRTREGEDFSYVNLDGELKKVEAWVQAPAALGDHGRMRLEKPDRIYCFDGHETIAYHPMRNEAYRFKGGGYTLEMLWPATWVRQIRKLPLDGVEILVNDEQNGTGRLVFRQKGAQTSSVPPPFLEDFDRETEIEWDLTTKKVVGLRRWVLYRGERTLFSELSAIEYLPHIDDEVFKPALPSDVRWGGVSPGGEGVENVGPREVAEGLLRAGARQDSQFLELYCPGPGMRRYLLDHPEMKVVHVGEPFRSGTYPGVYVPYQVRLDGQIKQGNLALRNDNEYNRWVFDGGF